MVPSGPLIAVCGSLLSRLLLLLAAAGCVLGAAIHQGPVPAPTDAWGAAGPHAVEQRQFTNLAYPLMEVTVFLPTGAEGVRPTWFFSHGFGGTDPQVYRTLLEHLCSQGYVVVYASYPTIASHAVRYETLNSGFVQAAERFPTRIDTSRVVFAGHSYGGGATPRMALRAVKERGWGAAALGLWVMAPWFSLELSDTDLAGFPSHARAVYQVYQDDLSNDFRIAVDLFGKLPLPAAQKCYMQVNADLVGSYDYQAAHSLPTSEHLTTDGRWSPYDAFDSWAVQRLASAFSASLFAADEAARALVFADGADHEIALGSAPGGRTLRPVLCQARPLPVYPMSRYAWPWTADENPRRSAPPPEFPARGASLVNLSARVLAGRDADSIVVGSVLGGTGHKNLLVRAVGESLRPFGLREVLDDPALHLFSGQTELLRQDDWGTQYTPGLQAVMAETGAFALPTDSRDAAFSLVFPQGAFTTQVGLKSGAAPAVCLVEAYDADLGTGAQLLNLSARARVGSGDGVMVAGWVVKGTGKLRLLVRAVGATLEAFGVPDCLADPRIEVFRDQQPLAGNDDWASDPVARAALKEAFAASKAFALPEEGRDAALILELGEGSYTAIVSGGDARTGIALFELYVLP